MAVKKKAEESTVLGFERKISPSDAMMYGTNWINRLDQTKWKAIKVIEKSIKGTISNIQDEATISDPLKMKKAVEKANLQLIDSASLPMDCDTLVTEFTLKVLAGFEQPCLCNVESHAAMIEEQGRKYIEKTGCKELARRYALNIANGRSLWRNKVGAEQCEVEVTVANTDKKFTFNCLDYVSFEIANVIDDKLSEFSEYIADALSGKTPYTLLHITTYAQLGNGQEVYPSQELVFNNADADKKKVLYTAQGQAALHSQKIGNAIRTIDTWYPEYTPKLGPIAIEVYGSVTTKSKAYRADKKTDFYHLFDTWSHGGELTENEEHYVVATLIRGGVFGKKSEKDK